MSKKPQSPSLSLHRFIHGIYDYYQDHGMPLQTAKARMYDDSLNTMFKFMQSEEEIPDHSLVIAMQFTSRVLNHRGVQLQNQLQDALAYVDQEKIASLRIALGQIKALKTDLDSFISTYKGGAQHGRENSN